MRKFIIIPFLITITSCQGGLAQEKNAKLIGGYDNLFKSISRETFLPKNCDVDGRVFVRFTISEDGSTNDVSLAKGLCPEADSIALVIVKRLKYSPSEKGGKAIAIKQLLRVPFKKE
ncbi:MAG: TonB family protein [Bacteroidota bacterium]